MRNKRENNTKTYLYAIIVVVAFILVAIGTSIAAYYVVVGNDDSKPIKVKTAYAVAMYEAKNNIDAIDILPGWTEQLKFVITNVSKENDTIGDYNLFLEIEKNDINNENFVYNIVGKSYLDGKEIEESDTNKIIKVTSDRRVPTASVSLGSGLFNTGVSHEYIITFKLKENGVNQDELQGKAFKAKIYAKGEPEMSKEGESNE